MEKHSISHYIVSQPTWNLKSILPVPKYPHIQFFPPFSKRPWRGRKKKVDQITAIKIIFLYFNVQNDLGDSKKAFQIFLLMPQSCSARNCKAAVVAMVISSPPGDNINGNQNAHSVWGTAMFRRRTTARSSNCHVPSAMTWKIHSVLDPLQAILTLPEVVAVLHSSKQLPWEGMFSSSCSPS